MGCQGSQRSQSNANSANVIVEDRGFRIRLRIDAEKFTVSSFPYLVCIPRTLYSSMRMTVQYSEYWSTRVPFTLGAYEIG